MDRTCSTRTYVFRMSLTLSGWSLWRRYMVFSVRDELYSFVCVCVCVLNCRLQCADAKKKKKKEEGEGKKEEE